MISIIIPACNEENYIKNTINSIRKQSFKDYEIIIVCDGCTDKTPEIAKKLADKTVILSKRSGPSIAKNEGVKVSKGKMLLFIDADTILTSNLLNYLSELKQDFIIGTTKIKPSNPKLKHRFMMALKNNIICRFGVSNGVIFCNKKTFNSVNGFPDVKKGEDGLFIRNLIKNKNKFIIVNHYVISSTRRFDKKGYFSVIGYWIKEYFKPSKNDYELIR